MHFSTLFHWNKLQWKSIKWSFGEKSFRSFQICWIFSTKNWPLVFDTWFTLNWTKLQTIHLYWLIFPVDFPLFPNKFTIVLINFAHFSRQLMKISIIFSLYSITDQQNDKLKRLSPWYPRHVLASIQKAWSYSTFHLHESVQNRRYCRHQGKYQWIHMNIRKKC